MPAVREYKTAAQIEAERRERVKQEAEVRRQVEQAYEQHKPLQVRFCADMLAAAKLTTGVEYAKGELRYGGGVS
jgi:putative IMPACT (imprinted ancient) family translation regulator